MKNSSITDRDQEYWRWESAHLEKVIAQQVRPRLAQGIIEHLSVFALAPQPLLIQLGALLSDIPTAEIYQLHREPPSWKWQQSSVLTEYKLDVPAKSAGPPALVLSLSATIADERVLAVLPNATLWRVSIDAPHNDFLQSREQAREFRVAMRRALDQMKAFHGQNAIIHVFPAMPVALAVDLGRIRMAKADLAFAIYDEDRGAGGFKYALRVG